MFGDMEMSTHAEALWVCGSGMLKMCGCCHMLCLCITKACSIDNLIQLDEYVAGLPPVPEPKASASKSEQPGVSARSVLVAQHPWAVHYLDDCQPMLKSRRKSNWKGGPCEELEEASDTEEGDPLVLSQQNVEDVFCQMAAAKSEVCNDHSGSFRVIPLGGQWTQKEKAIAQDAWQGKCCTAHSRQWCKDFGIVPSS